MTAQAQSFTFKYYAPFTNANQTVEAVDLDDALRQHGEFLKARCYEIDGCEYKGVYQGRKQVSTKRPLLLPWAASQKTKEAEPRCTKEQAALAKVINAYMAKHYPYRNMLVHVSGSAVAQWLEVREGDFEVAADLLDSAFENLALAKVNEMLEGHVEIPDDYSMLTLIDALKTPVQRQNFVAYVLGDRLPNGQPRISPRTKAYKALHEQMLESARHVVALARKALRNRDVELKAILGGLGE